MSFLIFRRFGRAGELSVGVEQHTRQLDSDVESLESSQGVSSASDDNNRSNEQRPRSLKDKAYSIKRQVVLGKRCCQGDVAYRLKHDCSEDEELEYITFRPLCKSDRTIIQQLHEEWFPVTYKDTFYDHLVEERLASRPSQKLFTCAAVHHRPHATLSKGPHGRNDFTSTGSTAKEDLSCFGWDDIPAPYLTQDDSSIIACLVGSFVEVQHMIPETLQATLIVDPTIHTKAFYLMTLGTAKEFRHCRLGTTLIEKCLDMLADAKECGVIYLHVIHFNVAAIRFYEKLGFYRVQTIPDYYRIDDRLEDCYLYAKYLHGNDGARDTYHWIKSSLWNVIRRVLGPKHYIVDDEDDDDDGEETSNSSPEEGGDCCQSEEDNLVNDSVALRLQR